MRIPGFIEEFFNTVRQGVFHNLAHISVKTDRIFKKFLPQM